MLTLVAMMLCMLCANVSAADTPKFETENTFSLRLSGERGIRVKTGIDTQVANDDAATEFGFIVTRKVFLDSNNISVEDFSVDSDVKKVTNCAKKTINGESIENFFDVNDETTYFTGVFVGIDEDHFDEVLVSKPYLVYNNEIYYGSAVSASYADIAELYQNNEEVFNQLSYNERRIIDDIVRRAGGFTKEIEENLIIPTTLNDTKTAREVIGLATNESTYYLYAFVDGEAKYVPVDKRYYDIYEEEICSYRVRNGLYCITPLAYVKDEEGNYIGIEKEDDSLLDYKNPDRTFYVSAIPDSDYDIISSSEDKYIIGNYQRKLEYLEGHSKIVVRTSGFGEYNNYICEYTKEEFDAIDFSSTEILEVKCVLSNNIESEESEYIDVLYLVVEGNAFEDKTPRYPVPEINILDGSFMIPNQGIMGLNYEKLPRRYFDKELGMDIWEVNAFVDGEEKYVPINTDGVLPEIIDKEAGFLLYGDMCAYTVDDNGIYHIKHLYYTDALGNYYGVEKDDVTVLDGDNEENLFVASIKNARFVKQSTNLFDAGFERQLDIEKSKIFVCVYNENDCTEEYMEVSYQDMKTMKYNASSIRLLIQNNPESNDVEKLVAAFIVTADFTFETCENSGHLYEETSRVNANCISEGRIYYTCQREGCTDKYNIPIPATGHSMMKAETVVKPTCSKRGYTVYKCNNPGCYHSSIEYTPATGHKLDEWITDREPTCTESGKKYGKCSVCGAVEYQVIKALGHDYEVIDSVEPDCYDDGYAKYKCTREGCGHEKRQYLESKGHSFGDDNICDVCGEVVEIHEHDYSKVNSVEPTCTTMGYTQYTCEVCGEFYRDNYIEPLGHILKEGSISVPATCTTSGRQKFTCEREGCGVSEDRVIPAGHNWSTTVSVEATCTSDGEATKTCMTCGETQTEIVKAHHKWDDGQIISQPDCENEGEKSCYCSACKTTEIFKIPANGHQYKNGYCIVCGDYFMDNIVYLEESQRYGMYFSINDIVSAYGPELVDEYGVYLDHNADANIKKVAVYLTQDGTMWRRSLAFTGTGITKATYVPYLAYDGELSYTGLNHGWINTFKLTKNKDGIYTYSNYATIGVNLEDSKGNLLLTLSDIGRAGYQTRVFDNLEDMKAWLLEGACEHNWQDSGFETEPTCTKGGVKKQTCSACDETRTVGVAPLGHDLSDWTVVDEPTLKEDGLEKRECSRCNYFETRDVPKLEPEKFDPAQLMVIIADKYGAGDTSTSVGYCDSTGKLEHYLNCYIDGEVQIPINPELFYPSIEDCYEESDETYYIGDVRSFGGTYAYVEKLATAVKGSDGRYVIKPVLHLENKNGDYIGVNRYISRLFDGTEELFGNDLGLDYKGYLNRLADGRITVVDNSGESLVGEIDEGVTVDYLNLTDETRIIIKDKTDGSYTSFGDYIDKSLISSLANEITNIQYVITNASVDESSADLLVLYAETSALKYKKHNVTYKIEANGNTTYDEVRDCSTLTLPEGPVVKNWIFTGWEIDGEQYEPGDIVTVTSDIVITGKYTKAFVVTIVKSCCNERTTIECANGEVITLPEAHACDGYRFDGWKITGTGITTETKNPGDEYTVTAKVTITSVTTRLWDVTYNYGCCGETEVVEVATGTKITLAKPEHKCDGYVFANFTIPDRQGNPKEYKVGDTVTISKDTSIDVVYKKLHTVTSYFYREKDDMELEISDINVEKIADGEEIMVPTFDLDLQNYTHVGWEVNMGGNVSRVDLCAIIRITADTEFTPIYEENISIIFHCYDIKYGEENHFDTVVRANFKEGQSVSLRHIHMAEEHWHFEGADEWSFTYEGREYSPDDEIIIEPNMEIYCYSATYNRHPVTISRYNDGEYAGIISEEWYIEGSIITLSKLEEDDYYIFDGWTYFGEELPIGFEIHVNGFIDLIAHYTHVPEYDPEDPETEILPDVDIELLEMVSQAREEMIDIRMSNVMHKETKQEIVDTVKHIMNDIYEGVEVDKEYVKEVYAENIDSIKAKVKEEMSEDDRSTFANLMLGGVSEDVKNFLSDYFGINLDNIEI